MALKEGQSSAFVAVESAYSMDGTVAPIRTMVVAVDEIFPARNAHLAVDEAHATAMYGRGMVAQLGLEGRVLARLHTFGKVLATSGGESISCHCHPCAKRALTPSRDIDEYLDSVLFAQLRASLDLHNVSAIIAASCSFDLLEDCTAKKVLSPFHPFAIRLPA